MENVIRIPPHQYIHVLDNNEIKTRLVVGPQTFIRKEHETIVEGPKKMINLPPRTYCKIQNPVLLQEGKPVLNDFGEVEVRQGDFEYRNAKDYPDPFPLYPGELLDGQVQNLVIVQQNTALKLMAIRDFQDGDKKRTAGEEYQQLGPLTYLPRVEEKILSVVKAIVIKTNTALRLKATITFVDRNNQKRRAGEEWLIRETGSYLPDTFEEVVEVVKGTILNDKKCIHLRALRNFTDVYNIKRKAGSEWLVKNTLGSVHIKDVYEQIIAIEQAITLSSRQQCVILNPYDETEKVNKWGQKVLVKGEKTFFLNPGEQLENGKIYEIEILGEDEALLLQATEQFEDEDQKRAAGERWIIKGPREYIAPTFVKILEKRKAIPLDTNEGIYVQDQRTGEVKEIKGTTYLLEAHETLWEKHLPDDVEKLVAKATSGQPYIPPKMNAKGEVSYDQEFKGKPRDKTRIICFKAPHNSAIQLYDYKLKKQRVVFGPDLVLLGPDEQFTVLNLSGGKPKKENIIQTLQLSLGPDFMTDLVIVETSDHAKLQLTLSYNWYFRVSDQTDEDEARKLFSVKDFVGDACKSIASRVRGAVSSITFEDFHHNSSLKIRESVFGRGSDGNIRNELIFNANNLVITSVDIQGQEITDAVTKKQLAQSINQAIEISSKAQEMNSRHQADKIQQEARSQLDRQKLEDQAKQEETKIKLLQQQAESLRVQYEGNAVSEASAKRVEAQIRGQAEVNRVQLKVQALQVEFDVEMEQLIKQQEAELKNQQDMVELEIKKSRELSKIEVDKFKQIVQAIGKETLVAMAKAGPETKAKMLKGLGLKGYLVTDGKNPINLFNTANGFMGQ